MIITRYLTREVLVSVVTVATILVLAMLSQQIVRYLNYVASGKIPTNVLIELVSFEVPYLLALLLPLALYLGVMLTLGRFYADNEMLILQMCGFGNRQILRLTGILAVLVGGIVLMLMLWINPHISGKRQQLLHNDQAMVHLIQTLIPGRFQATPDGKHVMFVETLTRDRQRAQNVFVAEQKKNVTTEQPAWMLVLAGQGYQTVDKATGEPFFIMADGYRYEGIPGENDYKIIQFRKYSVRLPQSDLQNLNIENAALSTDRLWQEYANPKRAAEFQWRFSIAISAMTLGLLAVPFSRVRPRQSRYLMLLPAVLIYIIYFNLLFLARHWVEQGFVPIAVGMWWVHGLAFLVLAILFFMQSKQWVTFKS